MQQPQEQEAYKLGQWLRWESKRGYFQEIGHLPFLHLGINMISAIHKAYGKGNKLEWWHPEF